MVLKVLVSNMCGTDLKAYVRGHPLIKSGTVMGHEYVGVVSEAGEGVRRFREGDRVVASNSAPCLSCPACRRGSYSLCQRIPSSLVGFSVDGAYAEYVRVPSQIVSRNTYILPQKPSPEELACAEPLASVIHALDRVTVKRGTTAAVVGSGALGLMFLKVLKSRGATVTMVNRSAGRLADAERMGADKALRVTAKDIVARIRAEAGRDGDGPDLVVEAVGTKETWDASFRAARDGGTALMFGGCASGTEVTFDAAKVHYGETSIIGSFHHEPSAFRRAVEAITSGDVDVRPLLGRRLPLKRILEGFKAMEERDTLKVSIVPD